ncbi:ImmA/IrrE family metallo-endopeptidase [Pseudomonas sp. NFX5]|jgi:Zn-dependent peptidase ImmA (M78 family)/DNA-binding XRE family transcriptional regulator|uniref:ImmA/IrrE family metallo-endopeptidase n=1 Tax=Pseudomonas sp. NFX5 TaxID=2816961 RepID=UPI003B8B553D
MANLNLSRLDFARKRRQLTQKKLAELSGVTQVTLSRIAKGVTIEPSTETVAAIAKALKYPVEFFYLDDVDELHSKQVSFRSLKSMTAKQTDAALASGALGYLFNDWVASKFNLPTQDLLDLRDEDPVSAAASIRRHWGLGFRPIPNLIKLLESKGVRIFTLSEGRDVDAFSFWRDGTPFIFLNTIKSSERSRFDAAHELGHLLMHAHGYTEGSDVERDADAFASNLLIPREDLIANLPSVRSISQIIASKKRWGVSVPALARSLRDVNILSDWHYREICKQIAIAGYRTKEPQSMDREFSVLWRKVLEELWKDRYTKESIADQLNLPLDEMDSLLQGVLGEQPEPNRPITPPRLRVV